MSQNQFYIYLIGFIFFFIGIYFHVQKKKKDISEISLKLLRLIFLNISNSSLEKTFRVWLTTSFKHFFLNCVIVSLPVYFSNGVVKKLPKLINENLKFTHGSNFFISKNTLNTLI